MDFRGLKKTKDNANRGLARIKYKTLKEKEFLMAKTVFILGTGASKEAGAPLIDEFLDVARDIITNGRLTEQTRKKI